MTLRDTIQVLQDYNENSREVAEAVVTDLRNYGKLLPLVSFAIASAECTHNQIPIMLFYDGGHWHMVVGHQYLGNYRSASEAMAPALQALSQTVMERLAASHQEALVQAALAWYQSDGVSAEQTPGVTDLNEAIATYIQNVIGEEQAS